MTEGTLKPLSLVIATRVLTLFKRIKARYTRPGAGYWPVLRLFYLRAGKTDGPGAAKPGAETIRETQTIYRVIERRIPGSQQMTERFNRMRTKFTERLIAKSGRLIEREVSAVGGSVSLTYVIGRSSIPAISKASDRRSVLAANRISELNVLYDSRILNKRIDIAFDANLSAIYASDGPVPIQSGKTDSVYGGTVRFPGKGKAPVYGGETSRVTRKFPVRTERVRAGKDGAVSERSSILRKAIPVVVPGRSSTLETYENIWSRTVPDLILTPSLSTTAAVSTVPGSGTGYPELVYGLPKTSGGGGDYANIEPREFSGRETNVYTGDTQDGDFKPTDRAVNVDYREITANLDFEYLSERLFRMFENAERTELGRRGLI